MAVIKQLKSIATNVSEKSIVQSTKDSAQQIWLAGLGAFAKAQAGGNKVFDELVKEGEALQTRTRATVEARVSQGAAKAGETWDKLEQVFENRVSGVLGRLGVPSRNEVGDLTARVEELTKLVEKLLEANGVSTKKPAAKKAAKAVEEVVEAEEEKSAFVTAAELEAAAQ
ncbi:phasin family protein [Chitinivorax sp. PXF-14]|uniref:phasin family protein n=1 Tax=Chitinivorax sp. PXF-14 TaxID=3230488 RepID=UPI003466724A